MRYTHGSRNCLDYKNVVIIIYDVNCLKIPQFAEHRVRDILCNHYFCILHYKHLRLCIIRYLIATNEALAPCRMRDGNWRLCASTLISQVLHQNIYKMKWTKDRIFTANMRKLAINEITSSDCPSRFLTIFIWKYTQERSEPPTNAPGRARALHKRPNVRVRWPIADGRAFS